MTAKTPLTGRPYVSLHTRIESDTDVLVLSWDARAMWPMLLVHSGGQGFDGRVEADARRVQLFVRHPNGIPAVAAALLELEEAGLLIPDPNGDPAFLYIRSWEKNQADISSPRRPGPQPGSAAAHLSALRRHHKDGKHTTVHQDCPECAEASIAVSAPAPEPITDVLPIDVPVNRAPKAGGMSEKLAELAAMLDESIPTFDTPFQGYAAALDEVEELAPKVAHLSKDARSSLRNAVLAHALRTYLGDDATSNVINSANRGAKALGQDGHLWYLHAAAKAAGRQFESESKRIGWLKSVATSSRSEQKAAA